MAAYWARIAMHEQELFGDLSAFRPLGILSALARYDEGPASAGPVVDG